MNTPWRQPPEESTDYPGLYVHDGRVAGSITLQQSRLPMWAVVGIWAHHDWKEAKASYPHMITDYEWDQPRLATFLTNLMELRGEFARLLCVLADEERKEDARNQEGKAWWEQKTSRKRVRKALERCLAVVSE